MSTSARTDRLVRHLPLVTGEADLRWRESEVAVAGLGVGGGVALQLALSGVGGLRIADGDQIDASNLNRHAIATSLDVGRLKTDVVAQHIHAVDSSIRLETFGAIASARSATEFVSGTSAVVEEVDDYLAKWQLRIAAREAGVPVVTATDLWTKVLIDVERFDYEPDRPVFHGLVSQEEGQDTAILRLYGRYAGDEFVEAVRSGGAFPQLGAASAVAGGIVAEMVRDMVTSGQGPNSGRWLLDLHTLREVSD